MSTLASRDITRLRELAHQWMEVATSPAMDEKRKGWKATRDLKGERPMIKCDAFLLDGYITDDQLQCQDLELRLVERGMLAKLRQIREVGDDFVINPVFRIPWKVDASDYGLEAAVHHAENHGAAYSYENPIQEVEDIDRLKKRTFSVDRDATNAFKEKMEYIFDDILPVRVGNIDYIFSGFGNNVMIGNFWSNSLFELFKYCGYERLMLWMMEEPEAIHALMKFFTEDKINYLHFLENERLLDYNTDAQFVGSVSFGFCSDLPACDTPRPAKLKDLWGWIEAQEGIVISPACYEEFVAPYLGMLSREFGLVQYGCCENHSDRYQQIIKECPNVRAFTTTYKWNNIQKLYDQCKGKQVIVCKPSPENICSAFPMWESYEKEMRDLRDITGGKNLEILIGDIITVNGDWDRFREAVDRFHRIMGI